MFRIMRVRQHIYAEHERLVLLLVVQQMIGENSVSFYGNSYSEVRHC
jgi:hypothetical protein